MNSKEYVMPDGKKAVFEYDHDGIGKITIEAMDMLMGLIADGRKRGEWIYGELELCEKCGRYRTKGRTCNIDEAPTIELHPEGETDGRRKEIKLEKRSMNEMISHFNRTVSEMDMSMPDKMTLLGIVTAIYQRYCEDTQQLDMETIKEGIEKQ